MIPLCKSELYEPFNPIYLRERLCRAMFAPILGLSSGSIAPFVILDTTPFEEPRRLFPMLLHHPNACTARRAALREKKRLRRAEKGMP